MKTPPTNLMQYSAHTLPSSPVTYTLAEEPDCAESDQSHYHPETLGNPATTPNAPMVPSNTADGSIWLYLRYPPITSKSRERRHAYPAETIHSYHAPVQCGMRQRPTHLKCNFMRYSDHTLPSPPVSPQQTALFPSAMVQCQESFVGNVDRLWPRTPPNNWSNPGSHVTAPLTVAFKAQPLILEVHNSIAEGCHPRVEGLSPPPDDHEMRVQQNPVAMMTQMPPSYSTAIASSVKASS